MTLKEQIATYLKSPILLGGLVWFGLLLIGGSWLYLLEQPAQGQARMQSHIHNTLKTAHQLLDHAIHEQREQLQRLTQSDLTSEQIQALLPAGAKVQRWQLGRYGIAGLSEAELPNSHTQVDQIRRAFNGEPAQPEALTQDGQVVLSWATAYKRESGSDILLVTLPPQTLIDALEPLGDWGQLRWQQQFGQGRALNVATLGKGLPDAMSEQQTSETVPHWQLTFQAGQTMELASHHSSLSPVVLLSLLAIVQLVLLIWVAQVNRRRIAAAYHTAPTRQLAAASALGNGVITRESATKVQELEDALEILESESQQQSRKSDTAKGAKKAARAPRIALDPTIFRAYDIRGVADQQLGDAQVNLIGLGLAKLAQARGQTAIYVARDGRLSSERISHTLIKGLLSGGIDVIDLGLVPTPVLYYATWEGETQSGIMVTGSHNPAADNGLKIVLERMPLAGAKLKTLHHVLTEEPPQPSATTGNYRQENWADRYQERITSDVVIAQPMKLVIDAGNGAAGQLAPALFRQLGCDVTELYCEIDGNFPNHHPDPSVAANLQDLVQAVQQHHADLGIAFDGDGDRMAVVTNSGKLIAADQLLMLLAQDVVARNPGADILFDVKCSRHVSRLVSQLGGRPIQWKSGHSLMKEKMKETGALLGGEFSGHFFFKERWFGFDDGLYSAARLLEILSMNGGDLEAELAMLPESVSTDELYIDCGDDERKFQLMVALARGGAFPEASRIIDLDGLRIEFNDGWGLVRASNTGPKLTLRFEADDAAALARIQQLMRQALLHVDPQLSVGF